MMSSLSLSLARPSLALLALALYSPLLGGDPSSQAADHDHDHDSQAVASKKTDWLTGQGVSLGDVLSPHLHFQSVYGGTTADDVEHFGSGHHDPVSDGWTIQGFEFGASLRPNDWFEGFATYHLFQDAGTREWDGEFEEWFGKIKNLPGGLELRGGRYLNRFGLQNHTHLHGWDYVDNNLVNGRFLGDDGMYTIGGELSWTLPVSWTSLLTVSVGVAPEHEHEHGHGGEEHADEALFETEGALFSDTFVVANWTNNWDYNDFHQFRFGASGAWGDNEFGRTTQVYGAHLEYLWRQNGYETGGNYFRWRTEAMIRAFEAVSGHEHEHAAHEEAEQEEHADAASGSFDEFGMYSAVAYGLDCGLEFGLRGEFVSGVPQADLDERYRISPVVTYYLNRARTLYVRGQYNFDHSNEFGDENSVWVQVGFNWGGGEVR